MLLFVGGIRSGKSSLARRWAETQAASRLFVASCLPQDAEMAARITRHKSERGQDWLCLEEGLDPQEALAAFFPRAPLKSGPAGRDTPGVVLFDCMSTWVANMLQAGLTQEEGLYRVRSFLQCLKGLHLPVALVSMETGLGLVSPNPVGRRFQDMLGLVNQAAAEICRTVIFVSCGLAVPLKGVLPEMLRGNA
jgi:adenosylcobinamide kinase/adenosylcobinamide-phosphate guanylyltransferase